MSFAKRLRAAVSANVAGQAITVAIQLLSVPIFLQIWGVEEYGNWLLLAAVPAYFALADFGFVAIAINKMTMLVARGDNEQAVSVFQSAIAFVLVVSAVTFVIFLALIAVVNVPLLQSWENRCALALLICAALFALSSGLFDAVFRSSGEYALGTHVINAIRLVEWLGMVSGLLAGGTILWAAFGQFVGRLAGSIVAVKLASVRHPTFIWGLGKANVSELRAMAAPAVSFMAFPVANAVSIQGMTLLVGSTFGAAFLATFSTYRTLSRSMVQVIAILARSLWPEISRRFGQGDMKTVVSIYRYGTAASVAISAICGLCVYWAGGIILNVWTSGRIPFDAGLFGLFLLTTVLTSLWQMGMVVLAATNSHSRFSVIYLLVSSGAIIFALFASHAIGVYAPVIALIGAEVVLTFFAWICVRGFRQSHEVFA